MFTCQASAYSVYLLYCTWRLIGKLLNGVTLYFQVGWVGCGQEVYFSSRGAIRNNGSAHGLVLSNSVRMHVTSATVVWCVRFLYTGNAVIATSVNVWILCCYIVVLWVTAAAPSQMGICLFKISFDICHEFGACVSRRDYYAPNKPMRLERLLLSHQQWLSGKRFTVVFSHDPIKEVSVV